MFFINGIQWRIRYVPAFSEYLQRSDGSYTIGMTDGNTNSVYICNKLRGEKLRHVICHELVHCFMFSHSIYIPIKQEEFIASWVADYGEELIVILDEIMISMIKNRAV